MSLNLPFSAPEDWTRFSPWDESTFPKPNFETSWGTFSRVLAAKENGERVLCSYDYMSGYFVDTHGEDVGPVVAYRYPEGIG